MNTSTVKTPSKSGSTPITAALFGPTGIALLSTAAVGIAGYFAWKNREKILGFVENYVDLPESITSAMKSKSSNHLASDASGLSGSTRGSTYSPSVEHRM